MKVRVSIGRLAMALSVVVSGAPRAALARSGDPDLVALLRQTGQYVRQFERDFAFVVSDESYNQQDRTASWPLRSRAMRSEVFFTWLGEDHAWITVRNVLTVDGMPVASNRDRLEHELNGTASGESRKSQFLLLREQGTRFNLGYIERTFNDPMFALQVIDPRFQSRFTFKLAGRETIDGVDAWRITWTEHQRQTLIVDHDHADLFSTGATWVSRADGVVLKTRLVVDDKKERLRGEMVVTYQHEPKLNLWVPIRMEERYRRRANPSIPSILREQVDCVATYSNFRRFETASRLVPPQ